MTLYQNNICGCSYKKLTYKAENCKNVLARYFDS